MNWFKHDTDASTDAKIKKLLIRHGAIGYAVYFHCLELIMGDVSETKVTFELEHDSEIIADNLHIKGDSEHSGREIVENIMRTIIDLGLFEENNGHLFCMKLLKRLDLSMTSNARLRKLIDEAKQNHDSIMINHDTVMTLPDKIMQDKIRKEEKRKEEIRQEEKEKRHKKKIDTSGAIQHYTENYSRLFSENRVNTEKPIVNYSQATVLLKNVMKTLSQDDVIKAIDNAMNDDWIVSQGYSLTTILSASQLNKLLNSKPQQQKKRDTQYSMAYDDTVNHDYSAKNNIVRDENGEIVEIGF